ncbi:MAG TPA: CAP domain-containing protein [Solirubrobacterales bacterium]|nr:CAP domain-containing protein [Solirubrobacterales bacterium]
MSVGIGRSVGAFTVLAAICALTVGTLALAGDAGAVAKGGCENATAPATQLSTGKLKKAVFCLINAERNAKGRRDLERDRRLAKTAQKHANKMVATDCLEHVCGGEPALETRIRNSGYFDGARRYDYAEDVGCERSAAQMVRNWMGSSLHRDNILERKFDDIGVGVHHGQVSSRCDPDFVTFAVVFGHRKG